MAQDGVQFGEGGLSEDSDEISGSIKSGNFLTSE